MIVGPPPIAVELAHRPVTVERHREAPAVLEHLLAGVLPGVHDIQPDEVDTRDPLPHALDCVQLAAGRSRIRA